MSKKFIKLVSLSGLLMVFVGGFFIRPAYALLIAVDTTYGVGTATRDTISGFEWLDLSLTRDFSFDTLTPELETGGLFNGYQLATRSEVSTFISNTDGFLAVGPEAFAAWNNLVTLLSAGVNDASGDGRGLTFLGITGESEKSSFTMPDDSNAYVGGHSVYGFLNERHSAGFGLGITDEASFNFDAVGSDGYPDYATINNPPNFPGFFGFPNEIQPSGFWLVKATSSTVPEPNIIFLLMIGLVGLTFSRLKYFSPILPRGNVNV